jgi:hypothetical protein
MNIPLPDDDGEVERGLADVERFLADQVAMPADGHTARVRELEAAAAEAARIRELPTERVLARQQALAEDEWLEQLDTIEHARKLTAAGERERTNLEAEAASAAAKRRLETNVHVRALLLSRRRRRWSTIAWTVLGLALSFTAVNVQAFAAAGAGVRDPQWWVAWGVDPLLSALVVGLLLAKGDLSVLGVKLRDDQGRLAKFAVGAVEIGALLAALIMNVSPELQRESPSWQLIVLHIVVPLAGMAAALVLPIIQERYSRAIDALYEGQDTAPYSGVTGPKYRHNAPQAARVTDHQMARVRELIALAKLPHDASANAIREALRCGMDTAREIRNMLRE